MLLLRAARPAPHVGDIGFCVLEIFWIFLVRLTDERHDAPEMRLHRALGSRCIIRRDRFDNSLVLLEKHLQVFDLHEHKMAESIYMNLGAIDFADGAGKARVRCNDSVKVFVRRIEPL
jgi:hypothetical protein